MNHIEFVVRDQTGITTIVTADGVLDADEVIEAIRSGRSSFFAGPSSWDLAPVETRSVLGSSFLFANWDGSKRNNLHDLASIKNCVRSLRNVTAAPTVTRRVLQRVRRMLSGFPPRG
jgi:hypothetical protein